MKCLYLIFLVCLSAPVLNAQAITTVAGGYNGIGRNSLDIGIAPINIAIDPGGNIFIAEPEKHLVRKLSPAGVYSIAAGTGIYGGAGDGGAATDARLKSPYSIAFDKDGNLLIADSYDHRIRSVATDGRISTIAGNRTAGFSGDGGLATNAQLNGPNAIATDLNGNIYIGDFSNNRVRKIDVNGIITSIVGDGTFGSGGDGGSAALAQLGYPIGLTTNLSGELFISDLSFNKIRKVDINGIITTVAGNGSVGGFGGDGGFATAAAFNSIEGSGYVDAAGNLYIPDTRNNRVRKVSASGIVQTIAGTGAPQFNGDESAAINAGIKNPVNVFGDGNGNLYITADDRIRKITPDGIIHTIAGNGLGGFSGNGMPGTLSQLFYPASLASDAAGNIYIADNGNNLVRKLDVNGILTNVAGNGTPGFSGDGGPAIEAQLNFPEELAIDPAGNLYIADFNNQRIRKVTPGGTITSFAGNGMRSFGGDGGLATAAGLNGPTGVAADILGNIYIADRNNQRIRKVGTDGFIQTIAGNGTAGFGGDGGNALAAAFNLPVSLSVNADGDLFITDQENFRIRKITAAGIISTVAGNGDQAYGGDGGPAANTGIAPTSVTVDRAGNFYIADDGHGRVRKVATGGTITTVAGGDTDYGDISSLGSPQLYTPQGVVLDNTGNLYLSDWANHRVLKISQSILPLNLLNFTASRTDKTVLLVWQTANEINTQNFIVQKSIDGVSFSSIGAVGATGTSTLNKYTYADQSVVSVPATKFYYRLQINDRDGKKAFSKVVIIDFDKEHDGVHVYPNPTGKTVFVSGPDIKTITIADPKGVLFSYIPVKSTLSSIDVSAYPKGLYILNVTYLNGTTVVKKLLVQ